MLGVWTWDQEVVSLKSAASLFFFFFEIALPSPLLSFMSRGLGKWLRRCAWHQEAVGLWVQTQSKQLQSAPLFSVTMVGPVSDTLR